jgi:histone-lysine N-methyltransferase SETMAR
MNLSREHFRAMIFYDLKVGLSASQCTERLQSAFGTSAPSQATVYNWFAELRRGRQSLQDEARSGRPVSAGGEDSVSAVQQLLQDDPRLSVESIADRVGISSGTVSTILHQRLGLRKLVCRWIPHVLNDNQRRVRIEWCSQMLSKFDGGRSRRVSEIVTGDETWVYTYDPETRQQSAQWTGKDDTSPVKPRRSRSVAKKMVATFVSRSGHLTTIPLESQRTVTANWYTTECLPLVLQEIHRKRPRTGTRGILLHHDCPVPGRFWTATDEPPSLQPRPGSL